IRFGRAARQLHPHQQTFATRIKPSHSGRCFSTLDHFIFFGKNSRLDGSRSRTTVPDTLRDWPMVSVPFRAVWNQSDADERSLSSDNPSARLFLVVPGVQARIPIAGRNGGSTSGKGGTGA